MSLEQKINYQLNKFPAVKKVIKRAYQTGMYAVSKKIKSEGNITRISPDDQNHEYFFGYYDKSPWDITDRYMLCMRADDTWSDVSPKEKANILIIDTQKAENDKDRVKKVAETRAWNVQQSCMLQWLGPDFSSRILYNDYRDGKYVSVILTLSTLEERVIPAAVYSVSADGKFALTLDFSRLYELRPGYGYYNVPEKTKGIALPDTTAIWKVDLETGEVSDVLKYTDFANFQPRPEMTEEGSVHKVNHIMLSPNGKRFMVLYRWFCGQRKYTRLVTCNVDGTDMYVLSDDDMVSHCFWKNNSAILAFENKKKSGPGYYLMKDKTDKYIHCWPQFSNDGHPSYSPDGSLIVTDSYPDRARVASINLMDGDERKKENTTIARVFAPFKYDNDTRCDLHPRWNHLGNKIAFDSVFEGHRGLYTVELNNKTHMTLSHDSLISVIVPVYNVEKYLKRCVESIETQTYQNFELILVNDGSTDSSLKICRELENKYSNIRIVDKKNGGLSSARNAGLKAATGEYVVFIDSDDWISKDYFEYALRIIKENRAEIADIKIAQVVGGADIPNNPIEEVKIYENQEILEHYLYRGLNEQNGAPYSACRKMYSRELFVDDTAQFVEGIVNEDICFNYRVLKKCKRIVVSNQFKYAYFQGEQGSITSGALKVRDLDLLSVCDELVELSYETKNEKIIKLAKIKRARSDFSLLARAALYGTKDIDENTINNMRKSLRTNIRLILNSPMPLNRKLMSLGIATNYKLTSKLFKLIR